MKLKSIGIDIQAIKSVARSLYGVKETEMKAGERGKRQDGVDRFTQSGKYPKHSTNGEMKGVSYARSGEMSLVDIDATPEDRIAGLTASRGTRTLVDREYDSPRAQRCNMRPRSRSRFFEAHLALASPPRSGISYSVSGARALGYLPFAERALEIHRESEDISHDARTNRKRIFQT